MRTLKIQGSSDKIYSVTADDNFNYSCQCSGFAANKFCPHVSKARDFWEKDFIANRNNLFSAFHKEVRRCDVHRGLTWAHIIKKFCQEKDVKDFYLGLCIEETRNITLYNAIYNGWRDKGQIAIAEMLLTSRKRWQSSHEWLPQLVKGYLSQVGGDAYAEDKIRRTLLNSSDISEWYGSVFSIFRSDNKAKLIRAFLEALKNRMFSVSRIPNRQEVKFLSDVKIGFHELLALCELAMGLWDEGMNAFAAIDKPYAKPNYIPRFEDYVHDNATPTGKERLYKKWFAVKFGKKQPDGVDLRWSGLAPGIIWRYFAVRQFGNDISQIPWDDVTIDDSDSVDNLVYNYRRVDACLHKMFYGTVLFHHAFDDKVDNDSFYVQILKDNNDHEDLARPLEYFGPKQQQ